jgi:hypothetical protein
MPQETPPDRLGDDVGREHSADGDARVGPAEDGRAGPASAPHLSPDWLTDALQPSATPPASGRAQVGEARAERLGVDLGLLGTLHRVDLTWAQGDGPPSVVTKAPATGEQSRSVATALDLYRNEVGFYRDLAGQTDLAVRCHHTAVDESTHDFVIVLDDMSADTAVDQVDGASEDQATSVVAALADHHARFWDEAGLDGARWLRPLDHPRFVDGLAAATRATWPAIRDRHRDRLDAPTVALGDRLADLVPRIAAELSRPPRTLAHGDVRLDNVFFDASGRVRLCDWQLTDRSRGMRDVALFVTQSLTPDVRARAEGALVEMYVSRLAERGVVGYTSDDAWRDYRAAAVLGLVYAVVAGGGLDHEGPRSRALTGAMLERSAAAIADHGTAMAG